MGEPLTPEQLASALRDAFHSRKWSVQNYEGADPPFSWQAIADATLDAAAAAPAGEGHIHTPTSKVGDTNAYCSTCGYFPLPLPDREDGA